MKMKSILFGMGLAAAMVACGPKDADIEQNIKDKLGDAPEIEVTVHQGVATIVGVCDDAAFKQNIERAVKSVKGVKTVINNCQFPQPDVEPAAAAVIINSDSDLDKSVSKVITAYDGVSATVVGGVVTLSGEIKRSQLQPLIQSIQELRPQKVDNQLIVK
jgi:hyperosmotically inducible protein